MNEKMKKVCGGSRAKVKVADILGGKGKPMWRDIRKGGHPALRSPEGRVYYGTAAEVRDEGLAPHRRNSLLNGLRCMHHAYISGSISREELRGYCAARRRDAIREGGYDRRMKHWAGLFPLRDLIRIRAAARSAGVDYGVFVERLVLVAVAEEEARCGGALPFSRHEREVLARCECV